MVQESNPSINLKSISTIDRSIIIDRILRMLKGLLLLLVLSLLATAAEKQQPAPQSIANKEKGAIYLRKKVAKLSKENKELRYQVALLKEASDVGYNLNDFDPKHKKAYFSDNIILNVLWVFGIVILMVLLSKLMGLVQAVSLPVAMYYMLRTYYQYEPWKLWTIVVVTSPLLGFIFVAIFGLAFVVILKRANFTRD